MIIRCGQWGRIDREIERINNLVRGMTIHTYFRFIDVTIAPNGATNAISKKNFYRGLMDIYIWGERGCDQDFTLGWKMKL